MVRYQKIMIVLNILSVLLLLVGRCRGRREIAIAMTRGASYLLIALAIVSRKSKKGVARVVGRATAFKYFRLLSPTHTRGTLPLSSTIW